MTEASKKPNEPFVTVKEFVDCNSDKLRLGVGAGERFLSKKITKKRLQKLGMALAGFDEYIQKGRIYVFGNTEHKFLEKLSHEERVKMLGRLNPDHVSCILITQGLDIYKEMIEFAEKNGIPILQTELDSSTAIYIFSEFLQIELSPRTIVHGVLIDVYGVGVLISGDSGVGKSECALELILKGHRLVADDAVEVRNVGNKQLVGRSPKRTRDVIELRGIGIVNVRELFGISAIRKTKDIHFLIHLERWNPQKEYDRLGYSMLEKTLCGINLPYIIIPVAPGRNLATLIEIACRVYLMRTHGLHPMGGFADKINIGDDLDEDN